MNKSTLTLALSLAALLGGGLILPNAVSAHDRGDTHKVERKHHYKYKHDKKRAKHRHRHHSDDWYLLRHHEVRPYGYRPIKRIHRLHRHHDQHQHRKHRAHKRHTHEHRDHSPVRLEIGYEIVL